ncbi:acyltransferase family protein [Streptomyces sp. NRRL S-920]|uniref:acyltransferase family protein n=1 Tax=Streptomyces sp. NRRL S-920 TaxID=1463921 RepID=UPI001F40D9FC|nr:acyltransferase [Streptomyces sp. NRRL S-920]
MTETLGTARSRKRPAVITENSPRSQLASLTGMRFFAAALVVCTHFGLYVRGNPDFWRNSGQIGVSFFFILSGFVLTWSARPDRSARDFWRRRLCKVFPNHLVTAVIHFALLCLVGVQLTQWQLLPTALLVQSWIPGFDLTTAVSPVSWSLSCELFFYAAFPFLLRCVVRIRDGRLWWWAAAMVAMIVCVPVVATYLVPDGNPMTPLLPYMNNDAWFVYFFPVTRALEFLLGMLVARLVMQGRWLPVGRIPAMLALALGFWMSMGAGLYSFVAVTVVPLALVIGSTAVADAAECRSLLGSRPMVWLGEVSFALYLVHKPVIDFSARGLGIPRFSGMDLTAQIGFFTFIFGVSVLVAWTLYRMVERPAMRRWSRARSQPQPSD